MKCPYSQNFCQIKDVSKKTCENNYKRCVYYRDLLERIRLFQEQNDGDLERLLPKDDNVD